MRPRLVASTLATSTACVLLATSFGLVFHFASLSNRLFAQPVAPSISTDKTGYLAGETVSISGIGFAADELVTIRVTHPDGTAELGAGHEAFTALSNAAGDVSATWTLGEDPAGNNFVLTATGGTTGPLRPAAFNRIAVVQTDKYDYQPGETAVISGAGFRPGELVRVQVEHSNGLNDGAGHLPFAASAGDDGRFTATWFVDPDDSLDSIFRLTATGTDSGLRATTTFTDALITLNDDGGPDDNVGQKDLNFLQVDDANLPTALAVNWGWDDTAWSGGNTGDACALFDTDGDRMANNAVCVGVGGNPAVEQYTNPVDMQRQSVRPMHGTEHGADYDWL